MVTSGRFDERRLSSSVASAKSGQAPRRLDSSLVIGGSQQRHTKLGAVNPSTPSTPRETPNVGRNFGYRERHGRANGGRTTDENNPRLAQHSKCGDARDHLALRFVKPELRRSCDNIGHTNWNCPISALSCERAVARSAQRRRFRSTFNTATQCSRQHKGCP